MKCFAKIAYSKSPRNFQKCRCLFIISLSSLNVIAFPLAIVCIILPFRVIFLSVSGGQWKAPSEALLHASVMLYENIHSMVYVRRKQMFLNVRNVRTLYLGELLLSVPADIFHLCTSPKKESI